MTKRQNFTGFLCAVGFISILLFPGCAQTNDIPTVTDIPTTDTLVPTDTAALTATWTIAPSDTSTAEASATPTPQNTATQEPTPTPEVLFGEGNKYIIWADRGPDTAPDKNVQAYLNTITPDIWKNATRLMVNTNGQMSELPWDARVVMNVAGKTRYGFPCVLGKIIDDSEEPLKKYIPMIFPGNGGMVIATEFLKFDEISISIEKFYHFLGEKGLPAAWLTSTVDNPVTQEEYLAALEDPAFTITYEKLKPPEREAIVRQLEGQQVLLFFINSSGDHLYGDNIIIQLFTSESLIPQDIVEASTIPDIVFLP